MSHGNALCVSAKPQCVPLVVHIELHLRQRWSNILIVSRDILIQCA